MSRTLLVSLLGWLVLLSGTGCARRAPEFTERKRIDEDLSAGDIARFLRVASALPDEPLAILDRVYPEVPNWGRTRTLPVAELLRLERTDLDNAWDVDWLARHHKPSKRLQRALLREEMTYEQFIALALSIGTSLSRSELRPEQDLDAIRERWLGESIDLDRDVRPFAAIPPEMQYRVLQRAAWLTRAHRAEKLANVPEGNIARVTEFRDRLEPFFSAELLENPFDPIVDPLDKYGIPFRETHVERAHANLVWSPDDAIVGTDPLDGESRQPSRGNPDRITLRPAPLW